MKLTDENGKEYEFEEKGTSAYNSSKVVGTLEPIEKEWPQDNDKVYWFDMAGNIRWDYYMEEFDGQLKFGNCFRTKEEAELARDRIQSLQEASNITVSDEYENEITFVVPKKYLKAWKALEDKE